MRLNYPDFFNPAYINTEKFFDLNENELKRLDSIFNQQEKILYKNQFDYQIEAGVTGSAEMIIHYSVNPMHGSPPPPPPISHKTRKIIKDQVKKLNKKALKVQDVIKKMTIEMESKPRTIEERIDKTELGKILSKIFEDKDINQKFEFAVISPEESQSLTLIRSDGFKPEFLSTKYRVSLFPNDIFQKQNILLVKFPRSGNSLLTSLSWLMIASILFTLIIVISSGLSIFVMIRQKKISDVKTDFINNMTHEFKTPIATISIAVDSINNPKVIQRPDVIKNYTRVIKEENNRMNTRVEQVLQMALLDSSEFKLNEKTLDIHEVIRNVTDNIRLQTESRNGQLIVNLEAQRMQVHADESHMTNVLISILDNAIKYSPVNPEIRVSTINSGSSIIISISDNGIGMNSETQKKIFDKFFRVTSGNIHNIKGFGLGLSYAKAIVLAHKGEIKVTSEVEKGSRFDIVLPSLVV
jgi:signal transduction histidine kinase